MLRIELESKNLVEINQFLNLLKDNQMANLSYLKEGKVHFVSLNINTKSLPKATRMLVNKMGLRNQSLSIKNKAKQKELIDLVGKYREKGKSYKKIANILNNEGYTNANNGFFDKEQVLQLYGLYYDKLANIRMKSLNVSYREVKEINRLGRLLTDEEKEMLRD